jgi:dihydrodipicolinate synthase/N-acetylneuraminate lyase
MCAGIQDSKSLAAHAESLKVDAIASLPPFFFRPTSVSVHFTHSLSSLCKSSRSEQLN